MTTCANQRRLGERNGNARLTASAVRAIRHIHALGASQAKIARVVGVGQSTISKVVRGVTWGHVEQRPRRQAWDG